MLFLISIRIIFQEIKMSTPPKKPYGPQKPEDKMPRKNVFPDNRYTGTQEDADKKHLSKKHDAVMEGVGPGADRMQQSRKQAEDTKREFEAAKGKVRTKGSAVAGQAADKANEQQATKQARKAEEERIRKDKERRERDYKR